MGGRAPGASPQQKTTYNVLEFIHVLVLFLVTAIPYGILSFNLVFIPSHNLIGWVTIGQVAYDALLMRKHYLLQHHCGSHPCG